MHARSAFRNATRVPILLFSTMLLSVVVHGQDEFDIAVCEANVDSYAREQCLKSIGANSTPKVASQPKRETKQPPSDWKENAEKHLAGASVYCSRRVERLAQYDFEWTDGWMEMKLSRYLPSEKPGVIIYIGDKIKFQNGFGAWQPHIYTCEYNTISETVIDVSAAPGRLP